LARTTKLAQSVPEALWTRIGLVKLDREGGEMAGLLGAAPIIAACRLPVLLEFVPEQLRRSGTDPHCVLAFLSDRGYTLMRPVGRADRWVACGAEDAMALDPARPNLLATLTPEHITDQAPHR
jgi:hypothetical protein